MSKGLKSRLEEKFGPHIIVRIVTSWIGIMLLCFSFFTEVKMAVALLVVSILLLGGNFKLLLKYKDR